MRYFDIGEKVRTEYGVGEVMRVRDVVGTKFQTSKRNKLDYLIRFSDTYIDWYEDYRVKPLRALRTDEAIDLYGSIKRVKRVGIYNDRTQFKGDYYLFYDEDEVYHLENKKTGKVVYTFSANGQQQAWVKALAYITKEL